MLGAESLCPQGPRWTEAPARPPCLPIYDQSQLDRADGWAPEAGGRAREEWWGGVGWGHSVLGNYKETSVCLLLDCVCV